MIYFYLFFLIRFATISMLTYLLLDQLSNFVRHYPNQNGLKDTRITLMVITFAIFIDTAVQFIGDLHQLLLGIPKQQWLSEIYFVLLLLRIALLYAIFRFTKLVKESDRGAKETKTDENK